MYLEMTGDSKLTVDDLTRMFSDPQIRYTLTPENMVKFAAFKKRIGTIKNTPASWKEMFFPEIYSLSGS